MTRDTCLCTTCMHTMIHNITLLHLGIISPSNTTIVAYVLRREIFKNKHSGRTTFTISSPSWYEVRHDWVKYEEFAPPPPPSDTLWNHNAQK